MGVLKESAQIVQDVIIQSGYNNQVIELPQSARTAQEAADALNCKVAQIAKSIIFRLVESNEPVLVIASGVNRVNEQQIELLLNQKLGKADAEFVREYTGFVIGGVSPIGHKNTLLTFIDEDLFQYEEIWAAAGHPKAIFQLTPNELLEMTKGTVVNIK
ncbi:YbaK/EbsC family protein [Gottfriedia solisilvae]|uniref:Cys-tRNA(Pro)/cys-tRNA(Cys) deacylase n=1 Tax=Gottfriedia solisilvae TaxID=1516104 RepID=A0A8J3AJE9_9BACI|nr:YbaK/EbsC family protein [Gottfriedia solisilvae]GGI15657.1 cys-tRNA(pro)/cys-tRNA(cys) deacylase [Gottfriedia solisilvae]